MPKKLPQTTFKRHIRKPDKPFGNLLISIPKAEVEVFGFKPGDYCEVTVKVLGRKESEK